MTNDRAIPTVVVTHPTPAITNGRPTMPTYWAKLDSVATHIEGPELVVNETTTSGTENVMVAGSNHVYAARYHPFKPTHVGVGIIVGGAGPSHGQLSGWISSVISSSEVTVVTNQGGSTPLNATYTVTASTSAAVTIDILSGHICAIKDPNPIWNPATSGWTTLPPPQVAGTPSAGHARWTVDTLPDPGDGFYWLGDPTGADGTLGSSAATHQWSPDGSSTSGTPSWRSFFPYKPSVTAVDHYLQGGGVVHHPKGVNFNPHYVEHMWLDFGSDHRQPFTWVIAGMVSNYPTPNYMHNFLDAGRNPDAVRFPRLPAEGPGVTRRIADNLPYRSWLGATVSTEYLSTRPQPHTGQKLIRARYNGHLRPKMFFGIFNGTSSYVGSYDPGLHYIQRGTVDNGSAQHHRYYVLGREQGWIGRDHASQILVFEIRYWHQALTGDDLLGQYKQLASTWKFNQYRAV